MEGVAFSLRDTFTSLGNDVPATTIRRAGAGARSKPATKFQRTFTDNQSKPVEAEEGAASAPAILAGVGAKAGRRLTRLRCRGARCGNVSPNSADSLVNGKGVRGLSPHLSRDESILS